MGSLAIIVVLAVLGFWCYHTGKKDGIRKAQEDAEREARPKEYGGRGPRDPIHDVMID